jgi:hypothetical protein
MKEKQAALEMSARVTHILDVSVQYGLCDDELY